MNIGKANAEIEALHKQLAALGHPEGKPGNGGFRFLRIAKANDEAARLQKIVGSLGQPVVGETISSPPADGSSEIPAKPVQPIAVRSAGVADGSPSMGAKSAPPVGQSTSGQPAQFPASTALRNTSAGAGLPGTLSRFQVLSALELFPAVAVSGGESDEDLRAMLKQATAEAGIRLPGDPAEPTPAELRQRALNAIVAAPAPAVAAGSWNLESLTTLVNSVFGVGTAENKCQAVSYYDVGSGSLAAKMNSFPPGSHQFNMAAEEMRKQARGKLSAQCSPQEQKRQLEVLRSFLCCSGVKVPGLSYAGIRVPQAAGERLSARQLPIAQAHVDAFCAVLSGDENSGLSDHRGAMAARRFIAATNRKPFTVGMLPAGCVPMSRV